MAEYRLVMPKMGESVIEATILSWKKNVGDAIAENEIILEVATDKVDSEVPCPVSGVLKEILFKENDVVAIGKVMAIIETEMTVEQADIPVENEVMVEEKIATPVVVTVEKIEEEPVVESVAVVEKTVEVAKETIATTVVNDKYFSPLVLNIAKTEGVSLAELDQLTGSGAGGRVTKEDILAYVADKKSGKAPVSAAEKIQTPVQEKKAVQEPIPSLGTSSLGDEIIEMDRMRKLIGKHMLESRRISPHVSSFVEVDVTNIVKWRDKHKDAFLKKEGIKLTFMPVFMEAIVKTIKDFPMINISVSSDGEKIIKKKDINLGMATALPNGNLIVPVIKNADRKSLVGLAAEIQSLAEKARKNSLSPEDIQGGTYTVSNMGTFGNIMGTGIINQPQVAIMVLGSVTKKPVVLETPEGDVIAIRHMMYLSHTYDHRVVDGMLGGMFVKRVKDYLEAFEVDREL
ncbi:MAG: 2-oxo acid dehydrogenase subunit E2 [Chitinophagales bacterium]|nr:2-oxo acid dehydrogenase subunit E2 [Chitinophagales bacterium]